MSPANDDFTALSKAERAELLRQNVPAELQVRTQWAGANRNKSPWNPRTGSFAKVNDPSTWVTFEEAINLLLQVNGIETIGYMVSVDDPYVGVDLDECFDQDGKLDPEKARHVEALSTYFEVSPSGGGLRGFVRAVQPGPAIKNKREKVEVYDRVRFLRMTGNVYRDLPITENQNALDRLYQQYTTHRLGETGARVRNWEYSPPYTDDEVLERVRRAGNADKFERLWAGDISGNDNDHSKADQALVGVLAYWAQDEEQLGRLVARSGLNRDKWSQAGYRARTINEVLDNLQHTYQCRRPEPVPDQRAFQPVYSAGDLLLREFAEPRWAVPGLVPEGLSALAGKPKMGKSWLALDIALGIATGTPVLGSVEAPVGDVLGLFVEDNPRRLQSRLSKLLTPQNGSVESLGNGKLRIKFGTMADPSRLMLANEWPRLDRGGLEKIDEWITSNPDARLVILDTFGRLKPRAGRGNAYDEDTEALAPLQRLALERGISILVLTHLRKQAVDDPLESINASMGFAGALDGVLVLGRTRGRADATLYVTGRDIEDDGEHALSWDPTTARWSLSGAAATARLTAERAEIYEAVTRAGGWISATAIAGSLGKQVQAVRYLAKKLVDEGLLESGRAGYRLLSGPTSSAM